MLILLCHNTTQYKLRENETKQDFFSGVGCVDTFPLGSLGLL